MMGALSTKDVIDWVLDNLQDSDMKSHAVKILQERDELVSTLRIIAGTQGIVSGDVLDGMKLIAKESTQRLETIHSLNKQIETLTFQIADLQARLMTAEVASRYADNLIGQLFNEQAIADMDKGSRFFTETLNFASAALEWYQIFESEDADDSV